MNVEYHAAEQRRANGDRGLGEEVLRAQDALRFRSSELGADVARLQEEKTPDHLVARRDVEGAYRAADDRDASDTRDRRRRRRDDDRIDALAVT